MGCFAEKGVKGSVEANKILLTTTFAFKPAETQVP